ncbi:MAG TPA: hypothetical protein DHV48_09080 [Prolixibacteraceae bacterium]|nr:hypothetical protein [Prolixibacteraceae bacterium]
MTEFIQNTTGLKPQHQQEAPLFEKTYIPPQWGAKLVSRMYADGSLYYLSRESHPETVESPDQHWNYISSVSEKGILLIKNMLEIGCGITDEIPLSGNSMGVVKWKIRHKNEIREIIIPGIPSGKFRIFTDIDEAVNSNIIKINVPG